MKGIINLQVHVHYDESKIYTVDVWRLKTLHVYTMYYIIYSALMSQVQWPCCQSLPLLPAKSSFHQVSTHPLCMSPSKHCSTYREGGRKEGIFIALKKTNKTKQKTKPSGTCTYICIAVPGRDCAAPCWWGPKARNSCPGFAPFFFWHCTFDFSCIQ